MNELTIWLSVNIYPQDSLMTVKIQGFQVLFASDVFLLGSVRRRHKVDLWLVSNDREFGSETSLCGQHTAVFHLHKQYPVAFLYLLASIQGSLQVHITLTSHSFESSLQSHIKFKHTFQRCCQPLGTSCFEKFLYSVQYHCISKYFIARWLYMVHPIKIAIKV